MPNIRNPVVTAATVVAAVLSMFTLPAPASGYSVLTHEAVIDIVWEDSLKPALRGRFPEASDEQLREAHAHAYGGVIVQDMGYYPLGTPFFSDLTHYVRAGEFIEEMLEEARDLNEYAFALGALAHYAGDNNGHPIATNRSVPLVYPKLRSKYGDSVSYVEDPTAHIRMEFAFDVLQVARGRYASDAYHDMIGFEVSEDLLERVFRRIYGLSLDEVLDNKRLAIASYRFSVSSLVPEVTEAAWDMKKDEIEKANPGIQRDKFVYRMDREAYEKEWGKDYRRPSTSAKMLGGILRLFPKIGPFKVQAFKPPTPEAERLYLESFDRTVSMYRDLITATRGGGPKLLDLNFDLGKPVRIGEYALADQAYEMWLRKLAKEDFETVTPAIRDTIVAFYSRRPETDTDQQPAEQRKASLRSIRDAQADLRKLRSVPEQALLAAAAATEAELRKQQAEQQAEAAEEREPAPASPRDEREHDDDEDDDDDD
jgi:hypothetical protein